MAVPAFFFYKSVELWFESFEFIARHMYFQKYGKMNMGQEKKKNISCVIDADSATYPRVDAWYLY